MAHSYLPLRSGEDEHPGSWVSLTVTGINAVLIISSAVILLYSTKEEPTKPVRDWIYGYILLCLFQTGLSWTKAWSESTNECDGNTAYFTLVYIVALTFWWFTGFVWVHSGGQLLQAQAPLLYWFTLILVTLYAVIFVATLCCFCCIVLGSYGRQLLHLQWKAHS